MNNGYEKFADWALKLLIAGGIAMLFSDVRGLTVEFADTARQIIGIDGKINLLNWRVERLEKADDSGIKRNQGAR